MMSDAGDDTTGAFEGKIRIHVTGFGPFNGVPSNPTSALVERLQRDAPSLTGVVISSTSVVETSVDGVEASLRRSRERRDVECGEIFLHLGVHGSATGFNLEANAFNEASFRVPDERGAQPWKEAINPSDGPISTCLVCPINIDALVSTMRQCGYSGVVRSEDAGRFLCNYIYYASQRRCRAEGGSALFVHVPPFTVLSEAAQYKQLLALIAALASAQKARAVAAAEERRCNAERQLWELECLQSMFPDALDVETVSLGAVTRAAASSPDGAEAVAKGTTVHVRSALRFVVTQLGDEAVDRCGVHCRFELPSRYPSHAAARIELVVAGVRCSDSADHTLTPSALHMVNEALREEGTARVGAEMCLQLLQRANELVREIISADIMACCATVAPSVEEEHARVLRARRGDALERDRALAVALAELEVEAARGAATECAAARAAAAAAAVPRLGRRCIYFHHIIARSKRKAVLEWAAEMGLGGFAKIGWPGVVVVEGEESSCVAYVAALQRLRWKQMVVRGEQTVDGAPGQSLDALRALPMGMLEIADDGMSELGQHCERCGVHELFMTVLGRRR